MKNDDQECDYITVSTGEEKLTAGIQYNSFSVPPIYYRTAIKPGETPEQAFERAMQFLRKAKARAYIEARDSYLQDVVDCTRAARNTKVSTS